MFPLHQLWPQSIDIKQFVEYLHQVWVEMQGVTNAFERQTLVDTEENDMLNRKEFFKETFLS